MWQAGRYRERERERTVVVCRWEGVVVVWGCGSSTRTHWHVVAMVTTSVSSLETVYAALADNHLIDYSTQYTASFLTTLTITVHIYNTYNYINALQVYLLYIDTLRIYLTGQTCNLYCNKLTSKRIKTMTLPQAVENSESKIILFY